MAYLYLFCFNVISNCVLNALYVPCTMYLFMRIKMMIIISSSNNTVFTHNN